MWVSVSDGGVVGTGFFSSLLTIAKLDKTYKQQFTDDEQK